MAMKEHEETMTETLTIERLCEILKYEPKKGLERFPIDDLERLAQQLEQRQLMPYIVKAIYRETHARRWLLNRDEEQK